MKKVILLAIAALFVFSAIAYAQTVPADKVRVNVKEALGVTGNQKPVFFDHSTHLPKLGNNCGQCHKDPKGGDKIVVQGEIKGTNNSNGAHNFCWSCHDKQPKPNKTPGKTCTKCHTGK